jgi:hypothetical protein
LGNEYQEDHGSRPAPANNSRDPAISKITRTKQTGGVAQAIEYLLCELTANTSPIEINKIK